MCPLTVDLNTWTTDVWLVQCCRRDLRGAEPHKSPLFARRRIQARSSFGLLVLVLDIIRNSLVRAQPKIQVNSTKLRGNFTIMGEGKQNVSIIMKGKIHSPLSTSPKMTTKDGACAADVALYTANLPCGNVAREITQPLARFLAARSTHSRPSCCTRGQAAGQGRAARRSGLASSGKPASQVKRSDPDFGMIVNERRNGRRTDC